MDKAKHHIGSDNLNTNSGHTFLVQQQWQLMGIEKQYKREGGLAERKLSLLDMDDHLFCGWSELENWAHCNETRSQDFSSRFPWPLSAVPSCFASRSAPREDDGSSAASTVSKNHSLAEKRRRDRINAQLALLRNHIPCSDKMDKAALLGSVVDQVKHLKTKAKEVSEVVTVPSDFDEVTIDCFLNQDQNSTGNAKTTENIFIQASICCDDRPDLFAELTQAFKSLKLTIISADMACLGGRIKSVLVLCAQNGKDGVCISSMVRSLKCQLSRIASLSTVINCNRSRSKRQRFFSTGQ